MRIYFGTVVRNAPMKSGGSLVELDWSTKSVLNQVPVYPTDPDLSHDANPRGNGRGCRGVLISGKYVIAANYHSLLIFDRNLSQTRIVSHGLMAGLHEICHGDNETVWVTSTTIDGVLCYDVHSGELKGSYWPREIPKIKNALNLRSFKINKSIDNRERYLNRDIHKDKGHVHVNAVAVWEGGVYALLNRYGVIADLSRGKVVLADKRLKGAHNLVINSEGIAFVNDTRRGGVTICDLKNQKVCKHIDLCNFPWIQSLKKKMHWQIIQKKIMFKLKLVNAPPGREIFVRGLALKNDRLFIGVSPASIIEIDWKKNAVITVYQHSKNVNECIHGLCLSKCV